MAKKKPKYVKILDGMNACYGGMDERDCSNCPYEKYSDEGFYGEGGAYCMIKLNEDARAWTQTMSTFCNCSDCICWNPHLDENGEWRDVENPEDGYCSTWRTMTMGVEYCSRGARKDDGN